MTVPSPRDAVPPTGSGTRRWAIVAAVLLVIAASGGATAYLLLHDRQPGNSGATSSAESLQAAPTSTLAPTPSQSKSLENSISSIVFTPAGPETLPFDRMVHMTCTYTTNEAGGVRIFTQPYTAGAETPGFGVNPSPVYPVGSGQATGFFTIGTAPAEVDQVLISMLDADQTKVLFETKVTVSYDFVAP